MVKHKPKMKMKMNCKEQDIAEYNIIESNRTEGNGTENGWFGILLDWINNVILMEHTLEVRICDDENRFEFVHRIAK